MHNLKFINFKIQDVNIFCDRQSPQSETKFEAVIFSKSANPFNFPLNSESRLLFKAKYVDP